MRPIFFFVLFPAIAFGQKNISTNLAEYMQAQAEINNFSGTVLVSKNGSVLLKKSYGLADYEWNVKNTIDTKYSLASVSKQFTAAAILQLVDKKRLALDDKLDKFFPGFPKGGSMTIHMLLCHMAGLQMDFDELYLNNVSITQDSVLSTSPKKIYCSLPAPAPPTATSDTICLPASSKKHQTKAMRNIWRPTSSKKPK